MDTPPRLTVARPDALAVADTVLPDGWQPSEDALLALSIALDLDVNAATVQFVDRYRGKRLSEATPATAPLTSWLHLWCVALVLEDGRRQVRFRRQLRATRAQIEAAHEIGGADRSAGARGGSAAADGDRVSDASLARIEAGRGLLRKRSGLTGPWPRMSTRSISRSRSR
ncbi:hypothetical protein RAJCM14343_1760 [Rhodococcus aetherivorans]|uniref:Uncharacterized protein n=1 Tax=Rhodococcus aetherivorans TaxID=191292 RepID=A0ABQ0YIZ5_9NOCA|nr:hypothetical protein [Rhodococcus aetherivorans]ETT27676.1 hypothetical protein RR21198_1724 [Rhodococcus rhodochrous ATCC 21198]KDE11519.1 hypothetical protein N505_0125200 [Rhodococcus aetherivorans]NGP29141.1 hypothetical protein [Rhodococcus aetherivorans]GES36508.1 hypothetical protein RAJCM14343_1760 [Rhodococcus aetherivorans]